MSRTRIRSDGPSGWQVVQVFDFTTLANQDFTSTADFTLNGIAFTTTLQDAPNINSFQAINGTGIDFDLVGSAAVSIGRVITPISNVITDVDERTIYALQWHHEGLSAAANFANVLVGLHNAGTYQAWCETSFNSTLFATVGTVLNFNYAGASNQGNAAARTAFLSEFIEMEVMGSETVTIRVLETWPGSYPAVRDTAFLDGAARERRQPSSIAYNYVPATTEVRYGAVGQQAGGDWTSVLKGLRVLRLTGS